MAAARREKEAAASLGVGKTFRYSAVLLLASLVGLVLLGATPGSLRARLFDAYQQAFPRQRISAPVVIVEIDDRSLARWGQWPWPRSLLAELVRRIAHEDPAAVGLDILMPEPDRTSPCDVSSYLPGVDPDLKKRLCRLPGNDDILAAALRSTPSVVGFAGIDAPPKRGSRAPLAAPAITKGGDPRPWLRHFASALTNVAPIDRAASGHGLLSADPDGVVIRRVPLAARVGDTSVPSLSVEMFRVAAGIPAFTIRAGKHGIERVGVGDLFVRTQTDGTLYVRYGHHDPQRFVSASDVLQGKIPPESFQRKLVLVAVTGLGLVDYQATALGERVPGAEIHAQVMESVFDGATLLRPRWSTSAEGITLGILGLLLLLAFARAGEAAILPVAAVGILGLTVAGGYLFRNEALLLDVASPGAGLAILGGYLFGGAFVAGRRQRRALKRELALQREAAARTAGELEAARRIQTGMLPRAERVFPGETRFDIAAAMRPAREVGGDLYDFFLLDDERLFVLIGDVAGKGLPASLFMAVAKALVKSAALGDCREVGVLAARANAEICRDNPELLFVTAVFAVFHLADWDVEFVAAGHESPYRVAADGAVERLPAEGGPPLCAVDDYPYPTERCRLAPGEALVFFTDGVTEAMDPLGRLLGRERFEAALSGATDNHPRRIVEAVRESVAAFAAGAAASDDFTVLAVRRPEQVVNAR
jgi:serine phosphatase RsbU (regulator of sigma subunit)/CHASE2 domain-containing sensor protein